MDTSKNQLFIDLFNIKNTGFYELTPFVDVPIGFGLKRRFGNNSSHVSLIHIFITNRDFNDTSTRRKSLSIYATYGETTKEGVRMRKQPKLSEPMDAEYYDEYFYDIEENKIYKKNGKEISGNKLLEEVYGKHIKSTRPITGLFLRVKVVFWRNFISTIFRWISFLFHYLLLLISGDKYTYEYLFGRETLNGIIISSKWDKDLEEANKVSKKGAQVKEVKKMDFFGFKEVSYWSIVFYSLLHLFLYWTFVNNGYMSSYWDKIFSSNFLTIIYVVVSFWFIEVPISYILKFCIKGVSILSAKSRHKKISI